MKKDKKIKIGMVGLGRVSPRHLEDSIKQMEELELYAVCDVDKKIAKILAKKEGVKYYLDYHDLVNDKEVDLVSVATPNYLHNRIGMLVAKSGKHCVMEKPISLNFLEAKKLTDAFDKSAGILFPVLQVRYNPAVITVKKFIDDGMFGRIHTAVLSIHWTRPQEYFDESNWKGRKKLDGGSLLTQAIHYIDVLQYVLGGVRSIYAKIDTVAHNIEVEDIANAILDLKSGTRVNFDFTICTYPQNMECSLTILGEKGTVKIGGLAMNKVEYWDVKDTPVPNIPEGLPPNIYAGGAYVGSCPNHQAIYGNVVDVIIHGKENHIEGKDALESLKIIDGIVTSSITKKEIVL